MLYKFHNRCVNDLAWIIASPNLMQNIEGVNAICISSKMFTHEYKRHLDWLKLLDKNPAPLLDHLNKDYFLILGKYAEELLHFFFLYSPFYELIWHSYQINNADRVIGELDFLVRPKNCKTLYHVEFAVKYFLSSNNHCDPNFWFGPNGKDSLIEKINRLKIQLNASQASEINSLFIQNGLQKPKPILITKGYFFYKENYNIPPKNANLNHSRAFYFSQDNFNYAWLKKFEYCCVVPKLMWLAPLFGNYNLLGVEPMLCENFSANKTFETEKKAYMLAVIELKNNIITELERVFVVE